MSSGASVAPEEADGPGVVVAAPKPATISDRTAIGTSALQILRISRHLPRRRRTGAAAPKVIPFDRPHGSLKNRGAPVADEEGRVFLRGISAETYGLSEFRRRQRAAPRVRRAGTVTDDATVGHSGDSDEGLSRTWWMLGPGDEPFLTQTLQVHFVELKPGGSNHGHGHQNEATFYILEGSGYEIHDGKRYDWATDDFVIVHTDSVHRHYNASKTERALALVIKAKATWMALGLIQQGRGKPLEDPERYEPARDWSTLWTPGATEKKKVVKKSETKWENTRDGFVRVISSPERTDVRTNSVDLYEQEIASKSARHWHMADEVAYVLSGSGESV